MGIAKAIIEVRFERPDWPFNPGQRLFLNCRKFGPRIWQPVTITSSPQDQFLSIHFSARSSLGRTLRNAPFPTDVDIEDAVSNLQPSGFRIDGPYGKMPNDILDYDITILVAEGRGIFPWMAYLKNLWFKTQQPPLASPTSATSSRVSFLEGAWSSRSKAADRGLPGIHLIWTCYDTELFDSVQALLLILEKDMSAATSLTRYLKLQIHIDQIIDHDTMMNIVLNSVGSDVDPITGLRTKSFWFKPNYGSGLRRIRDQEIKETEHTGYDRKRKIDIGVYYCGPHNAAKPVKNACRNSADSEARVRFRNICLYQ